ncbi:DUF3857 domain-containing protein [Gaetbulibacter saemankumensis]|uniref:DUF3857 domain-containing protein n=1 Tax=Gaetbulibacter saemankumensis TaxID=311208 RepID=UPI0003F85D9E|nr:DUF3857 domain-containing protein [Gaetbulibacter saemankumensis]
MKNLILSIVVLTMSQLVLAQDYDFRDVSKSELQEVYCSIDSSANAAYLYKKRRSYYYYNKESGFQLITEVHERIKIYNQKGYDYATKSVYLYRSSKDEEKLTGLKAYTYNLGTDGKIEETKLKKDGIFETERSEYYNETKFTMPNVKEGSVIEYEYRIVSPFSQNVDEFVFQHDIPVKKLLSKFEVPEYYTFKVSTKGFLMVSPEVESVSDKITFTNKTRTGYNISKTNFEYSDVEFTKTVSTYHLENVPALKDEPYVNNLDNYRSAVKYELSFMKFPDSPIKYITTTWEDVVKTIYDSPNFGTELNKTNYFEDDIDALIATAQEPEKRLSLIYAYLKSRVKWNGYYSKYASEGVKSAYKDQVGNSAEINLMLTAMLRYAGLDAYPVLVSTRNNGVPLFPTREGYNYVISSVKLSEGYVLLDGTSEYSSPNILPYRTLNWQGRIIKKDGLSKLIDLYPKNNSIHSITVMANMAETGKVEGALRSSKTNHDALLYREKYLKANKDDFLDKLENKYVGFEISDFKVSNATELAKPILESYKFIKEEQADIVGEKMYFSPLLFLKTNENPFKSENREFPIDFGYPSAQKYRVIINIPEGYVVESVPENVSLALPDNLGDFKYVLTTSGQSIQLMLNIELNQAIVSPLYYKTLKEYFKRIVDKENEQIVLTKV